MFESCFIFSCRYQKSTTFIHIQSASLWQQKGCQAISSCPQTIPSRPVRVKAATCQLFLWLSEASVAVDYLLEESDHKKEKLSKEKANDEKRISYTSLYLNRVAKYIS